METAVPAVSHSLPCILTVYYIANYYIISKLLVYQGIQTLLRVCVIWHHFLMLVGEEDFHACMGGSAPQIECLLFPLACVLFLLATWILGKQCMQ